MTDFNEQLSNSAGLLITTGAAVLALNIASKIANPRDNPQKLKKCSKCGSHMRKTVFGEEYCPCDRRMGF